jgi:hypothetical protein
MVVGGHHVVPGHMMMKQDYWKLLSDDCCANDECANSHKSGASERLNMIIIVRITNVHHHY